MLAGSILLMVFDPSQLFRTVNLNYSPFLDTFMRVMTEVGDGMWVTIILAVMAVVFKSCRNWWFVLAAAFCNIAPALLIQGIKSLVEAPRPLEYYKLEILKDHGWVHIREQWPHLFYRSFPSGHAGAIFSLCCFISMILPKGW